MFAGRLSRRDYARAAGTRLGLAIVGMLAIPAALYVVDQNQYCPAEFCGALSAVLITFIVMPALYLGLMVSLIGITVRRMRDMGIPVALAAVVPALMLGDLMTCITLDGFVLNTDQPGVFHPIPGNLIMALACIAFLCVAGSAEESSGEDGGRWGMAGAIALGVAMFAGVFAIFQFVSELGVAAGVAQSSRFFVYAMSYAGALIAPIMLIVLLVLIVRRQRQSRTA